MSLTNLHNTWIVKLEKASRNHSTNVLKNLAEIMHIVNDQIQPKIVSGTMINLRQIV